MASLNKIRAIAREKNIKLKDIAAKLDMTPNGIQNIINTGSTNLKTLESIAAILDVPVKVFFEDTPQERFVADFRIEAYNNAMEVIKELRQEVKFLKGQIKHKDMVIQHFLGKSEDQQNADND